jgi:HK97 gp10 family phage protein
MPKVDGLASLATRLARIPQQTKTELQAELQRSAQDLVALQSSLAPVDQGDLASSIKTSPGKNELAIRVEAGGPNAVYARWQEFGREGQPAQPFFFPAFRALRRTIKRRLSRVAGKAARRDASQV